MTTNKTKKGIFHRLVDSIAKGDEEKEMYVWDICYRYELWLALVFVALIAFAQYKLAPNSIRLILLPLMAAGLTVLPLYEQNGDKGFSKREDIGQLRLALSGVIGWLSLALLVAIPIMMLIDSPTDKQLLASVLCIVVIVAVYIIASDYVKWRFDWAVKHYDCLFSRHYRWWTSGLDYDVQRLNMKYKFMRSYKTNTAVLLIAGTMCVLILVLSSPFLQHGYSKDARQNSSVSYTEQTETSSKSDVDEANQPRSFTVIKGQSTDDIADNNNADAVDGRNNEEGDPPGELDLPAYMVLESQWTMHGTIGSYRVNGTVTFTQDGLHGQYGYDGKKTGITLRGGPVDENDGHLFAQEFNYKGEQCGEYHGIFTYPKTCKGVFTNHKGETFDFVWHFE